MARVTYRFTEDITVTFDAKEGLKGLISALGEFEEARAVMAKCGHCGSANTRLLHKTPQGYEYHMVKCIDCNYEFSFGVGKDTGKLFPKWKDGWQPPYSANS